MSALNSRVIDLVDMCLMCNGNSENALHLFVLCPVADKVWRSSSCGSFRYSAQSFAGWFEQFVNNHDNESVSMATMLVWSI